MSSHEDTRPWNAEEEAEKARLRAIDLDIPEEIRSAARRASSVHEDPLIVVANWMREEAAKLADEENQMCAGGSGIAKAIAAAIRKLGRKVRI